MPRLMPARMRKAFSIKKSSSSGRGSALDGADSPSLSFYLSISMLVTSCGESRTLSLSGSVSCANLRQRRAKMSMRGHKNAEQEQTSSTRLRWRTLTRIARVSEKQQRAERAGSGEWRAENVCSWLHLVVLRFDDTYCLISFLAPSCGTFYFRNYFFCIT